jgi:S-adenosylmethionine hydrolase
MPPTVAFLTDFGTRDHYAGATKGAVLAACPGATLVDIAHDLPPHDIAEAAFTLASTFRAFPAGTVFVAVVDPGVGSRRRGVALEAGGYHFVGPDNGIFTFILDELSERRVHTISNAGLFRHEVSATFHARDVFAPVAAHLARGGSLDEVGPPLSDPHVFSIEALKHVGEGEWEACVLHVDRFGNLITNLGRGDVEAILEHVGGDPTRVVFEVEGIILPMVTAYSDVSEGEACGLMGSGARVEISVNRGNAARQLGVTTGAPVRFRIVTPQGPFA